MNITTVKEPFAKERQTILAKLIISFYTPQ